MGWEQDLSISQFLETARVY